MRKPRLSYANVMSTLAVFIALGGGAYAATELDDNSVKSRHIAPKAVKKSDLGPGSVTSAKIVQGTVTKADVAPGVIPAPPNLTPFVRYGSTIPSGTTVTGVFYARSTNDGDNANNAIATAGVSLPARASSTLLEEEVNFGPSVVGNDDDPTCTGSFANPTAPPGKVCLYGSKAGSDQSDNSVSGDQIDDGSTRGFAVVATGGHDVGVAGVWAYRQP